MDKDLFIMQASLILSPWAFVFFCLSLPAKSIKCNLLVFSTALPLLLINEVVRKILNKRWERELSAFISVEATCLDFNPIKIKFFASLAVFISTSVIPWTYIPFFGSSFILSSFNLSFLFDELLLLLFWDSFFNKSMIDSWYNSITQNFIFILIFLHLSVFPPVMIFFTFDSSLNK